MSSSQCLLCLSSNTTTVNSTAFKMLLRYLKVDMNAMIKLAKVGRDSPNPFHISWNYNVPLCEECSSVAHDFLELFQAFEGIRLQLDLCVRQLYEFMEEGGKDPDRVREFQERINTGTMDKISGNVLECLRNETMAKALLKVGWPRVSLKSLPEEETMEKIPLANEDKPFSSEEVAKENETVIPTAFKCPSCDKFLASEQGLKVHFARRHSLSSSSSLPSQKAFKCDHCDRSFAIEEHLQTHLIFIHPVATYGNQIPSGVSDQEFNKAVTRILSKSMQPRKQCGAPRLKFVCPNCGERIQHFNAMRLHIVSHHLEKVIESVEKAKVYCFHKTRERQRPTTTFDSRQVDYSSVPRISLRCQIMKFRNRQKNLLSSSFLRQDQKSKLKNCYQSAAGGSRYKCSFCRKILPSQHGLKLHYASKHVLSQKLKVWKCDHCEHRCTYEANLHVHKMFLHPAATFAAKLPSGISDQEFVKALTRVVGKCTKIESGEGSRSGQLWKIKCPHCESGTATQMASMKLHIMRFHLDEIIEVTGKVTRNFSCKIEEGDQDHNGKNRLKVISKVRRRSHLIHLKKIIVMPT